MVFLHVRTVKPAAKSQTAINLIETHRGGAAGILIWPHLILIHTGFDLFSFDLLCWILWLSATTGNTWQEQRRLLWDGVKPQAWGFHGLQFRPLSQQDVHASASVKTSELCEIQLPSCLSPQGPRLFQEPSLLNYLDDVAEWMKPRADLWSGPAPGLSFTQWGYPGLYSLMSL